jgi:hypothetical protein
MESAIKVHNILVKHCKRTQWDKQSVSSILSYSSFAFHTDTHNTPPLWQWNRISSCTISWWSIEKEHSETNNQFLHFYHIHLSHFIQSLTTLDLSGNGIGDKGAKYLVEALQKNTVRQTISFFTSIIFIFRISYRHSQHSTSLAMESDLKVHNILVKHCKRTQWDKQSVSSFLSYSSFAFHTDTHNTQPLWQWNRVSRCTISCWSIAKEHSETSNQFLHFDHIHLSHFIQKLTTLDLSSNGIEPSGAQYLAEALQKNTVRQTISFFISIIFIFRISYRNSQHSTSW